MYAAVTNIAENPNLGLQTLMLANILLPVTITDSTNVISVDSLNCTAVFIQTEKVNEAVVAKMPNKLSRAVFK